MSKNLALITLVSILVFVVVPIVLVAQESNIVFPIAELGNCTDKESCREYCEIAGHEEGCVRFALENGLMTEEEALRALKYLNQTGPGGCQGEACRAYCEDPANIDECISFAEEHGLIKKEEAEKFKKFRAIEKSGGPGGCKGEACRDYCEDVVHRDECFQFARENELLDDEEIKNYETGLKIREKIEESGGPGGCTSENECRNYCSDINYIEECVEFGVVHSGQSQDEVQRMLQHLKEIRRGFENNREFKRPEMNQGEFQEGQFEGSGSSDFRGRPDMRTMNEEDKRRMMEEYQGQSPMPRDTMMPTDSMGPMMTPDRQVEYQKYMQEYPNTTPPSGNTMMPTSDYPMPSSGSYQPPSGSYQPSSGEMMPSAPPSSFPSPSSPSTYDHSKSFVANVISAFLAPFRK